MTTRKTKSVNCGFRSDIHCVRKRVTGKAKGNKNETQTGLATKKDDECNFMFPVFYHEMVGLFFVKRNCYHCFEHTGHIPTNPEHMSHGL